MMAMVLCTWGWYLVIVLCIGCFDSYHAGIPGFNQYLLGKQFESTFHMVRPDSSFLHSIGIDHLCFDMGSNLHECVKDDLEPNRFFKRLFNQLDRVITLANPQKSVVFAFDGVAPFAKMCTQRKRRAQGGVNVALTPGTDFMNSVDDNILTFVLQRARKVAESCPNLQFYLSSPSDPEEGEVKIVQWILSHITSPSQFFPSSSSKDYNSNRTRNNILIVGSDGDLIIQSLLLGALNLKASPEIPRKASNRVDFNACYPFPYILSTHQHHSNTKPRGYILRNMSAIYDDFSQRLNMPLSRPSAADIALLFLFLGDDYLPRLSMGALPLVLPVVATVFSRLPESERRLYDTASKSFYWPTLIKVMSALEKSQSIRRPIDVQPPLVVPKVDPIALVDKWWRSHSLSKRNHSIRDGNYLRPLHWDLLSGSSIVDEEVTNVNSDDQIDNVGSIERNIDGDRKCGEKHHADLQMKSGRRGAHELIAAYKCSVTVTAVSNRSVANPKPSSNRTAHDEKCCDAEISTVRIHVPGGFPSLREAKRAAAVSLLQAKLPFSGIDDNQWYYETQYLQENKRLDQLQEKVNRYIKEFNSQEVRTYTDFLTFVCTKPNASEILRRVDRQQMVRGLPSVAAVETYLYGLLWVMDMYSSGHCSDFGFEYRDFFRPHIAPSDVLHYWESMKAAADGDEDLAYQQMSSHLRLREHTKRQNRSVTKALQDDIYSIAVLPPAAEQAVPPSLQAMWRQVQRHLFQETMPSNDTIPGVDGIASSCMKVCNRTEEMPAVTDVMERITYDTLVQSLGFIAGNRTVLRDGKFRWRRLQLKLPIATSASPSRRFHSPIHPSTNSRRTQVTDPIDKITADLRRKWISSPFSRRHLSIHDSPDHAAPSSTAREETGDLTFYREVPISRLSPQRQRLGKENILVFPKSCFHVTERNAEMWRIFEARLGEDQDATTSFQ